MFIWIMLQDRVWTLATALTDIEQWLHGLVAPIKEEGIQAKEKGLRLVDHLGRVVYLVVA
jgi:hypothetical protein